MKKIRVLICFIVLITLVGCGKQSKNEAEPSTSNETWAKMEQQVKMDPNGHRKNSENWYYIGKITFDPLCKEDHIASIEYNLEDCTGTFMDKNLTDPYANEVTSVPYLLNGNNQDGIYFTFYFNVAPDLTNAQKVEQVGGLLEKARINLTITYEDGSVKYRTFAIKLATNSNYTNLDLYEISKK